MKRAPDGLTRRGRAESAIAVQIGAAFVEQLGVGGDATFLVQNHMG